MKGGKLFIILIFVLLVPFAFATYQKPLFIFHFPSFSPITGHASGEGYIYKIWTEKKSAQEAGQGNQFDCNSFCTQNFNGGDCFNYNEIPQRGLWIAQGNCQNHKTCYCRTGSSLPNFICEQDCDAYCKENGGGSGVCAGLLKSNEFNIRNSGRMCSENNKCYCVTKKISESIPPSCGFTPPNQDSDCNSFCTQKPYYSKGICLKGDEELNENGIFINENNGECYGNNEKCWCELKSSEAGNRGQGNCNGKCENSFGSDFFGVCTNNHLKWNGYVSRNPSGFSTGCNFGVSCHCFKESSSPPVPPNTCNGYCHELVFEGKTGAGKCLSQDSQEAEDEIIHMSQGYDSF